MRSLILIALFGLYGCVSKQLIALDDYEPIVRGAESPDVAVVLRVEDARPLRPGGGLSDIGVMNEGLGSSTELQLSDPATIRYLVQAATKDALRLARIGVSAQAPRTLVVTVRKFWVAVPSREEHVILDLVLQDRQGVSLWSAPVVGGAGGWIWTESNLRGVYQRSLVDYAELAAKAFASPEFQRQLY